MTEKFKPVEFALTKVLGKSKLSFLYFSANTPAGDYDGIEVREGMARISDASLATTNLNYCTALALHFQSKNEEVVSKVFLAHVNQFVTRKILTDAIEFFLKDCQKGQLKINYWQGPYAKFEPVYGSSASNLKSYQIVEDVLRHTFNCTKAEVRAFFRADIVDPKDVVHVTAEGTFEVRSLGNSNDPHNDSDSDDELRSFGSPIESVEEEKPKKSSKLSSPLCGSFSRSPFGHFSKAWDDRSDSNPSPTPTLKSFP